MPRKTKWILAAFLAFTLASLGQAEDFLTMANDLKGYLFDPQTNPGLTQGKFEPEYGDAFVYGSSYIYHRAMAGEEVSEAELEIAEAMTQRYEGYLERFEKNPLKSFQDMDTMMHTYIGVGGVYFGSFYSPDRKKQILIERYLDDFKFFAQHPGILYFYPIQPYGPGTVLFGLASFYLQYPMSFPASARAEEFKKVGLDLISKLDKNFWSEKEQKYLFDLVPGYDFTYAYTNAVAVQALARAYYLTGDRHYYDRAVLALDTLERDLFQRDYSGYLAAEADSRYQRQYQKFNPLYNQDYMPLSGLNYMVYAYLLLYEAGGFKENEFLQKAERDLAFPQKYLWDQKGRVQHHLAQGKLSPEADYCAGCNLQLLYNIFLIQQARQGKPIILLKNRER